MKNSVDLQRLLDGFHFCTHCGDLSLGPTEPAWKTTCYGCFQKMKPLGYDQRYAKGFCLECGIAIERNVLEADRRIGGKIMHCLSCCRNAAANEPFERRTSLVDSLTTAS